MMRIMFALGFICTLVLPACANTIFSFYGVGDPVRRVDARSRSMGGAGRSLADGLNFSSHNPALLGAFRRTSVSVQFVAQHRFLNGGNVVNDGDVGAFQIALPLGRSLIVGAGLEPLTDMDFGAIEDRGTGDLKYQLEVEATGGIQAISLGLGHRVGRRLFVGGRINWVAMGTLNESWLKNFDNETIFFSHDEITRTHRGWLPSFGIIYIPTLRWSLGANIDFGGSIKQRQIQRNRFVEQREAVEVMTESDVEFPREFGVGITYLAGYRWLASVDVSRGLWQATGDGRFDTWDVSTGMLWRTGNPDVLVRSRRFELSAGFHYRSLYFPTASNSQINELGASFGVALPFVNNSGRFRYVLEVGKRGDRSKHGTSERFIQHSFSVVGFVR
ncbi:MAG: hypothetical protein J4F29_02170 [Candidatus Latescibacteria bacterium]|nr:hypothetical protein [Candidatus Latescibacterota bacterium]